MRYAILFVLIICLCLGMISCKDIFAPEPKKANVIVIEGPIFEDGYWIFQVKGRVQNKGDATAKFAKITIYIRDSAGSLLAQETSYIDDTDLAPNETSPWGVLFWDEDSAIRNNMNFSKTTWEIKWD